MPREPCRLGQLVEVILQRVDGGAGAVGPLDVRWLAVETGVYTEAADGVTMEAATFASTVTDTASSWVGQPVAMANSYSNPAVVGQVATANDGRWSAFWSRGASRTAPPSRTS